ncbi:hypothetical protein HMPREF1317_2311 [Schaalia georgiae F0490]|uniref:Uncharacterized protein n=1 Tax=Schaalia georgiae F0490 TaxID=1125717 RepID=J0NPS8_9ACTO|nr:hypothetical protein HMPREF1317_2311 [Schaalia georgiae F0490]
MQKAHALMQEGRGLMQKVHAPQGRTPPAGLIALPIAPSGPKCVWVSQF